MAFGWGEVVEKGHVIDTFGNRIRGRYPVHDIVDPETGGAVASQDQAHDA